MASNDDDYELFCSKLAQALKNERKRQGLTQEELSLRCGVSRSFIASIESRKDSPSLNSLFLLAKGLGVEVRSLIPGPR